MAVPHYAYLKLKMPGNNGTPLTVHGSFLRSDNCDKEFNRIAQKFAGKNHLALTDKVDPSTPSAKTKKVPPVEVSPLIKETTAAKESTAPLLPTDSSTSTALSKFPAEE